MADEPADDADAPTENESEHAAGDYARSDPGDLPAGHVPPAALLEAAREATTDDGAAGADVEPGAADPHLPLYEREARHIEDRDAWRQSEDSDHDLIRLLRTPTRVAILVELARAEVGPLSGEAHPGYLTTPMTVADLAERTQYVSPASFSKHRDALLEAGVIREVEPAEGEQAGRWALDMDHPVAAALAMAVSIVDWHSTDVLVPDEYLGQPGLVDDGGRG